MLFFIRGSVIFDLHKQVTNDTLGLEFFEIRYEDADNRRNDVKDDIEFAQGNVIPLWAFGMNY